MAIKGGYKSKLTACRELRSSGGESAYERAKLLCEVFEDRQFRADCGDVDDLKLAAQLDEFVEDLCVDFLDLRAMLAFAPNRVQWADGRLKRLRAEMMQAQEDAQPEVERKTPRRASVAELDAATERADEAEQKARFFKTEADQLREQVGELRGEIQKLREENAMLRGRISELERRELVAA